jgi:hypothetical protein
MVFKKTTNVRQTRNVVNYNFTPQKKKKKNIAKKNYRKTKLFINISRI